MSENVTPDWLKGALKGLLAHHKLDAEEPLLAAIVYIDDGEPIVLEIVRNFGGALVSDEADFAAATFGRAEGFAIPADKSARFRFTSPEELAAAISGEWPVIGRIRAAQANGGVDIVEPAEDHDVARLLQDALEVVA